MTDDRLPFEELVEAVKRNSATFARRTWLTVDGVECPLYQVAIREAGCPRRAGKASSAVGEEVFQALTNRYDVDRSILSAFLALVDGRCSTDSTSLSFMEFIDPRDYERVLALFNAQPGLRGD